MPPRPPLQADSLGAIGAGPRPRSILRTHQPAPTPAAPAGLFVTTEPTPLDSSPRNSRLLVPAHLFGGLWRWGCVSVTPFYCQINTSALDTRHLFREGTPLRGTPFAPFLEGSPGGTRVPCRGRESFPNEERESAPAKCRCKAGYRRTRQVCCDSSNVSAIISNSVCRARSGDRCGTYRSPTAKRPRG